MNSTAIFKNENNNKILRFVSESCNHHGFVFGNITSFLELYSRCHSGLLPRGKPNPFQDKSQKNFFQKKNYIPNNKFYLKIRKKYIPKNF